MSAAPSDSLRSVYVVTMWSGGHPSKTWKTLEVPELLPQGTGVAFINLDTKLRVQVIGDITIEEYEQGSALLEKAYKAREWDIPEGAAVPYEETQRGAQSPGDDPPPRSGTIPFKG